MHKKKSASRVAKYFVPGCKGFDRKYESAQGSSLRFPIFIVSSEKEKIFPSLRSRELHMSKISKPTHRTRYQKEREREREREQQKREKLMQHRTEETRETFVQRDSGSSRSPTGSTFVDRNMEDRKRGCSIRGTRVYGSPRSAVKVKGKRWRGGELAPMRSTK